MRIKTKHILNRTKRDKMLLWKIKTKDKLGDPLWNMIGSSSSKDRDLSVNHDAYLYGKSR